MLVLIDSGDPIGRWWFEAPSRDASRRARADLDVQLALCRLAAEALEAHGVMTPTSAVLGRWLRVDADGKQALVREAPPERVHLVGEGGAVPLFAAIASTLDRLERERSFLYPAEIRLSGATHVVDRRGVEQSLEGALQIDGVVIHARAVGVTTWTDAWLPWSLDGEPQHAAAQANGARLAAALREIAASVGTTANDAASTPFARCTDFALETVRDASGEPFPMNVAADRVRWRSAEDVRLDHHEEPVGAWWFPLDAATPSEEALGQAIGVFARAGLCRPALLVVEDGSGADPSTRREIALDPNAPEEDWRRHLPPSRDVTVLGFGTLAMPEGEREVYDLVRVELVSVGGPWLCVATHRGVWLASTLEGRPQQALHDLNAARLERALEELVRLLGVTPEPPEPGETLARVEGFGLRVDPAAG